MPFESVEISSSSAGSYVFVNSVMGGACKAKGGKEGGYTFCIGSTTVARLLDLNVGNTVPTFFFASMDRVRTLEEQLFNMIYGRLRVSSPCPCELEFL